MALNSNAHFAHLPNVGVQRSILDRSHDFKFTGNVGDLIPVYNDPDILPGDTVSLDISSIIRFQTMLSPVYDNLVADFHAYFVPHRLVWTHWEDFMGDNKVSSWTPSTSYTVPMIKVPATGSGSNNYVGSLLDYLGFPVEMSYASGVSYEEFSALPVRDYALIADTWYRSQEVTDPINIYYGDNDVIATTDASYINDVPQGGKPFRVSKFRDYFSSSLPSPQRGSDVLLPIQQFAPVGTRSVAWTDTSIGTGVLKFTELQGTLPSGNHSFDVYSNGTGGITSYANGGTFSPSNPVDITPNNLWADLSQATAVSVNDLRFAFQLQKMLEKDAFGGRYKEIIKTHFNVDTPDARLQRPEFLGGFRVPITVNQVTNTAQTSSDPLGDVGAYSVTGDKHSMFTKSFTEHGTLMIVMCIRAEKTYSQGVMPQYRRKNRTDFYWPVFANIGNTAVPKSSIYLGASGTWGYQEAWAEYRFAPNRAGAFMRPYVSGALGSWSYADDYNSAPTLSDGWIREDPTNVDRTLAVTSAVSHQFWSDLYFKVKHTRPMPVYSIPGLIDHH